jgi:transcriptional regulator with XRE-family HTH domain
LITPAQIRAARALLGWSQEDLAGHAGVAVRSLIAFELNERALRGQTLSKITEALERAGIEFVGTAVILGVLLHRRL